MSNTETETNGQLLSGLREAIVAGIPDVQLHDHGHYVTVKHGSRTLGYVNGSRKIRVDFPVRGGSREQLKVTDPAQYPETVDRLRGFISPLEQEANPDPKPARKRKTAA